MNKEKTIRETSLLLACVTYAVANHDHIFGDTVKVCFPSDVELDELIELGAKLQREITLAYVKEKLDDPKWYDYSLLAHMLRDFVDPNDKDLKTLAWELGSGQYGVTKGDVRSLIEIMEEKDVEL